MGLYHLDRISLAVHFASNEFYLYKSQHLLTIIHHNHNGVHTQRIQHCDVPHVYGWPSYDYHEFPNRIGNHQQRPPYAPLRPNEVANYTIPNVALGAAVCSNTRLASHCSATPLPNSSA